MKLRSEKITGVQHNTPVSLAEEIFNRYALFSAVIDGKVETVRDLVHTHNTDVNFLYDTVEDIWHYGESWHNGESPLHAAIRCDELEVVEDLLEGGADVFSLNGIGDTPFLTAAAEGNVGAMQALYRHNPDVIYNFNEDFIYDDDGNARRVEIPALAYSVRWGHYKATKWLIEHPRKYSREETATRLFEGAEISEEIAGQLFDVETARELFEGGELSEERAKKLLEREEITKELFEAVSLRRVPHKKEYEVASPALIDLLIQNGANLNSLNNEGQTPLHCFLEKGMEILREGDYAPESMIEVAKDTVDIAIYLLNGGNENILAYPCASNFTPLGQIAWAFHGLVPADAPWDNSLRLYHDRLGKYVKNYPNRNNNDGDGVAYDNILINIQLALIAKLVDLLNAYGADMTLDVNDMVEGQEEEEDEEDEGYRVAFERFQTLLNNTYHERNAENPPESESDDSCLSPRARNHEHPSSIWARSHTEGARMEEEDEEEEEEEEEEGEAYWAKVLSGDFKFTLD